MLCFIVVRLLYGSGYLDLNYQNDVYVSNDSSYFANNDNNDISNPTCAK